MGSEVFKAMARKAMNSAEAAVLDYCTLDPAPPGAEENDAAYTNPPPHTLSPLINHWMEWERTLRLNLAHGRAQKLNRAPGDIPIAPELPVDAVKTANTALFMESPLEAELFLDKARWDAIESFLDYNIFSENSVYAYLLKLLLMERRAMFVAEEGFTEYKGLYAAIIKNAGSVTVAGFTPGLSSETSEPGEPK